MDDPLGVGTPTHRPRRARLPQLHHAERLAEDHPRKEDPKDRHQVAENGRLPGADALDPEVPPEKGQQRGRERQVRQREPGPGRRGGQRRPGSVRQDQGNQEPTPTIIPYPNEATGPKRRIASFDRIEYRAHTIPLKSSKKSPSNCLPTCAPRKSSG